MSVPWGYLAKEFTARVWGFFFAVAEWLCKKKFSSTCDILYVGKFWFCERQTEKIEQTMCLLWRFMAEKGYWEL